jgi:hypothetical protein
MGRLNLQQASLLDASGELGEVARQKLVIRIVDDPVARRQYEAAQADLAVLQILPMPEPSAAERLAIPAMIKKAIRLALRERETQVGGGVAAHDTWGASRLSRWAAGALALAACAAIVMTLAALDRSQEARQRAQIARINATIERVSMVPDQMLAERVQALTNAETALRQWEAESPTLSYALEADLSSRVNALAASDADGAAETPDPSGPPG